MKKKIKAWIMIYPEGFNRAKPTILWQEPTDRDILTAEIFKCKIVPCEITYKKK